MRFLTTQQSPHALQSPAPHRPLFRTNPAPYQDCSGTLLYDKRPPAHRQRRAAAADPGTDNSNPARPPVRPALPAAQSPHRAVRARDAPQRCYRGPCGPPAAPGGTSRGALPAAPGTSVPAPPLRRGAAGRMRANGVRWRSRGRLPSARARLRPGAPRPRPGEEARPADAARPEVPRDRMRGAPARPSARPAHRPPAGGCSLASLTWAWSQRRSTELGSAPRSLSGSRSLCSPPPGNQRQSADGRAGSLFIPTPLRGRLLGPGQRR